MWVILYSDMWIWKILCQIFKKWRVLIISWKIIYCINFWYLILFCISCVPRAIVECPHLSENQTQNRKVSKWGVCYHIGRTTNCDSLRFSNCEWCQGLIKFHFPLSHRLIHALSHWSIIFTITLSQAKLSCVFILLPSRLWRVQITWQQLADL